MGTNYPHQNMLLPTRTPWRRAWEIHVILQDVCSTSWGLWRRSRQFQCNFHLLGSWIVCRGLVTVHSPGIAWLSMGILFKQTRNFELEQADCDLLFDNRPASLKFRSDFRILKCDKNVHKCGKSSKIHPFRGELPEILHRLLLSIHSTPSLAWRLELAMIRS